MYAGQIVFAQLMELLPLHEFHKCVQRYNGNHKVQRFSCLDQFLCMAFAQLTYRESLRDIAYVYATKNQSENGNAGKILETISKNQERISGLEATLAKLALEKREGEDIPALHQKVLGAAEKFIREHAGEFSFLCQNCRTVIQADGLPHWALVKGEYEGAKYYFIFNSQLWQLVLEKKIPAAYIAFALRTSIVGIKFTVEARKERWLDWIDVLQEKKVLKELMDAYKLDGIDEQKKHIENLGGGA